MQNAREYGPTSDRSGESDYEESPLHVLMVTFLFLVLMGLLATGGVWLLLNGGDLLDASGYLSHSVQSTITAQSDWLAGESKSCISIPLEAQIAHALGKKPGYAFFYLKCDAGPERRIRVTFWGKENQPESKVAYWDCMRTQDSFTCRQTGADPK